MKNKIVATGENMYMVHIRTHSVILLASVSEPLPLATPTPDTIGAPAPDPIGTAAYAPALVLPTTLLDETTLMLTPAPSVSTPALPSCFRLF